LICHFVVQNPDFPASREDIELVFGRLDPLEEIIEVQSADLAAMAVEAGIFPSKGQSRKSGLGGPAPHGLHMIGTKKRRFWVWNPIASDEKVTLSPSFDKTQGWFK
jgi:hypothetical protein